MLKALVTISVKSDTFVQLAVYCDGKTRKSKSNGGSLYWLPKIATSGKISGLGLDFQVLTVAKISKKTYSTTCAPLRACMIDITYESRSI